MISNLKAAEFTGRSPKPSITNTGSGISSATGINGDARQDDTRVVLDHDRGRAVVRRQRGQTETYRGVEYSVNLLRKVVLEIVVNDDFVDRTVQTIEQVSRTGPDGNIGDGKIFQLPVLETIRIGQTVTGPEAV